MQTVRLGGLELVIRQAEPADAPQWLHLVDAASRESDQLTFGPDEVSLGVAQQQAILKQYRRSIRDLQLLGLVDGVIVATLSLSSGRRPQVRHCAEFSMMVRRAFWGRGIGGAMLDATLVWAQAAEGIRKLGFRVRTDNSRAIALVERRRFRREGTHPGEVYVAGEYHDQYSMGLQLLEDLE